MPSLKLDDNFILMRSKLIHFKSGVEKSLLEFLWNIPWVNDTFTLSVISGAVISTTSLSKFVGIGSSSQLCMASF